MDDGRARWARWACWARWARWGAGGLVGRFEEKKELSVDINRLPVEQLGAIVEIIHRQNPSLPVRCSAHFPSGSTAVSRSLPWQGPPAARVGTPGVCVWGGGVRPGLKSSGEIEIDIDSLNTRTLREMERCVREQLKKPWGPVMPAAAPAKPKVRTVLSFARARGCQDHRADAGKGRMAVGWTAPLVNGGDRIVNYRVRGGRGAGALR